MRDPPVENPSQGSRGSYPQDLDSPVLQLCSSLGEQCSETRAEQKSPREMLSRSKIN